MSIIALTNQIQKTLSPVISSFASPKNLGRFATFMPGRLNCQMVQSLLNHAFSEQVEEGDFEFLADRALQIEIIDAGLFVGLTYRGDKIICTHFAATAFDSDVKLSVDTLSAIKLAQQEVDPDTLFFHRKLKISGDTELAHHVKNTIDTLSPKNPRVYIETGG